MQNLNDKNKENTHTDTAFRSTDDEEDCVWYLAYGSNLHPTTLEDKRNVYPKESLPCIAPTYKLVFTCPGLPYLEPCFASIAPIVEEKEEDDDEQNEITKANNTSYDTFNDNKKEWEEDTSKDKQQEKKNTNVHGQSSSSKTVPQKLHGVAHRITTQEFVQIQKTEGGGGYENLGYNVISIHVTTYSGKEIECLTLLWDADVKTKCASKNSLDHIRPSKRYWNLLVEGSEHHGLDAKYQSWLKETIPYYNGPQTLGTRIGRGITLIFGAMISSPLLFSSFFFKVVGRYPPRWVFAATLSVVESLYLLHDLVLRRIFGSGTA